MRKFNNLKCHSNALRHNGGDFAKVSLYYVRQGCERSAVGLICAIHLLRRQMSNSLKTTFELLLQF